MAGLNAIMVWTSIGILTMVSEEGLERRATFDTADNI